MNVAGVVSDTHGLLRPEIFRIFKSVDLIIHAGDIGKPEVLEQLRGIAPTIAVRGNNDKGIWAKQIPVSQITEIGGVRIYMIHDLKELDPEFPVSNFQIVVSGHSHKPSIQRRDGILFLNPGSAGPRRFKLPITVARLFIQGARVSAKLMELEPGGVAARLTQQV